MKNTIFGALLAIALSFNAFADNTNSVAASNSKAELFAVEVTLGGAGIVTTKGDSAFGVDFSIATNPLKANPNIWVGVIQGLYWDPNFSGATDLYAEYSIHIYKDLYLNAGWEGGIVYDSSDHYWRTGPEASFQYYVSDDAFIYVGANYDFNFHDCVPDGLRYGFGIGLHF